MITNTQRIDAYKKASEYVIQICSSLETGQLLGQLAKKYSVRKEYIDIVGDVLIGLRDRTHFEQDIVSEIGVTPEIARSLATELKQLFDKALSGITVPGANIEAKEKLELRPHVPPPPQGTSPVYGTATPLPQAPKSTIPTTPRPAPAMPIPQNGSGTPPAQGGTQSRPLTREELMNALGAKRTMASDMERARGGTQVPTPSYGTPPPPSSSVPPPPPSGR